MIDDAIRAAVTAAVAPVLGELAAVRAELAAVRAALPPTCGSVADAARVLGVSQLTVRRQIAAGRLAARKVGARVIVDLSRLRPAGGDEIAEMAREARR